MYTIIGIRDVNFTDAKSGAQIIGKTIYVTHKVDGVIGEEGKKYFVKQGIKFDVSIGSKVDIFFDDRGKITSILKVLDK